MATNSDKIIDIKKKDDGTKVVFSKEYDFEGKKIKEVDLKGLDDLTANDLIKANKVFTTNGNVATVPEITLEYAIILAASVTHLPIEFYEQLISKDILKVKNRVVNFLYGEE